MSAECTGLRRRPPSACSGSGASSGRMDSRRRVIHDGSMALLASRLEYRTLATRDTLSQWSRYRMSVLSCSWIQCASSPNSDAVPRCSLAVVLGSSSAFMPVRNPTAMLSAKRTTRMYHSGSDVISETLTSPTLPVMTLSSVVGIASAQYSRV